MRQRESLIIEVEDDGPGLRRVGQLREGIGLSNTRARLQQLYGDKQDLQLLEGGSGGLLVRVTLPYRSEIPEDSTAMDDASAELDTALVGVTPRA
jgi:LytS/YehU family sensor histidine kinase